MRFFVIGWHLLLGLTCLFMSTTTIILALSMVGAALFLVYEAAKSISKEFDFELNLQLPRISLFKLQLATKVPEQEKSKFRHNF